MNMPLLGVRRHATPARLPRRGPRLSALSPDLKQPSIFPVRCCLTKRRQAVAGQSGVGPPHSKEAPSPNVTITIPFPG